MFPSWAVDDIYVGEKCPHMCNGRGDCNNGVCQCDKGYYGECVSVTRGVTVSVARGIMVSVTRGITVSVSV